MSNGAGGREGEGGRGEGGGREGEGGGREGEGGGGRGREGEGGGGRGREELGSERGESLRTGEGDKFSCRKEVIVWKVVSMVL